MGHFGHEVMVRTWDLGLIGRRLTLAALLNV